MTDPESLRRKIADEEARLARIDKERAEVLDRLKDLRTGRLAEATRRFRNRSRPMVCHSRPKSPPQPRRRSLSSGVYSEGGRMSSRNCGRTQRPGGKDTPQP